MSTIRKVFASKKTLFIPFIMAGAPNPDITLEALFVLEDAGVDMVEIGVPFSDPIADGPINQRAAEIALTHGMSLMRTLDLIAEARRKGCQIPIIIFSYLNPLLAMGFELFAHAAQSAGVNGVLIVDLPMEEGLEYYPLLHKYNLEPILLASPTTDIKRLSYYPAINPGFVYVISRLGVTGTQSSIPFALQSQIKQLRLVLPGIPLAVGFGISTKEQVTQVEQFADGVIMGSTLVEALDKGMDEFKRVISLVCE